MSYTLKLTNGTTLLTLADQQTDNVSTSLTLIGKNVNAYGADLNDNFIRLLENFANTAQPTSPLVGQLWFNTLEQRVYFYNNSLQFKPVGGPIVAATQPNDLVAGDLWIDSNARQLNFYDGANLVTAGPGYNYKLGKSGVLVETVVDSSNVNQTVGILYSNSSTLGIISNSAFNLRSDYVASTGLTSVGVGINLVPGVQFIGTATSALSVNGINGDNLIISTTTASQTLNSALGIFNDDGLTIGLGEDLQFYVNTAGNNRIATIALGAAQDFDFITETASSATIHCLYFSSSTGCLGIFNNNPSVGVDIASDLQVRGNLTVIGTSTYLTTVNLRVDNKTIDLAYSTVTTSDIVAAGGGIVLHGNTNKTFTWNLGYGSWDSSENINLVSGKSYLINGVPVISGNSLGSAITSAPGLTNLSGLLTATIGQVVITTSTIGLKTTGPLIIGTGQSTAVDFNGKKLQNAYTPSVSDASNVVATKGYVDSAVSVARGGQFAINVDVTGHAANPEDPAIDTFVINLLGYMLPPGDPSPYGISDNSRARVLITRYQSSATTAISSPIGFNSVNVYQAGTTNPVSVVGYQSNYVASVPIAAGTLSVNRAIKQYIVSGGVWIKYIYTGTSNTVYTDGTW